MQPSFLLTVIIPAYNEESTVVKVLDAVHQASGDKQIIVVDDCSTDRTAALAEEWCRTKDGREDSFLVIRVQQNSGKGYAIREGLKSARGEYVIIQDADLECTPDDFPRLLKPMLAGEADIIFGSRYSFEENHAPWNANRVCVVLLNWMVRLLFGVRLEDEACSYKMFRTSTLKAFDLKCRRFEFCPEVTAKACLCKLQIKEIPVRYCARTKKEGKKIRWWDGVHAFAVLLRWRFTGFTPLTELAVRGASPESAPKVELRE